ncbi:MAG: NAD(P)/FAD-dependent oxidoreductase [Candidatus Magasanikbacteria bacterium]|nr:NAD(P)/FAD-dependent oxidoreductase [Candidatus Magasanikbacteria bacterium]
MKPIRIIIVGAGFGGIYTLKRMHQLFHKDNRVQITLVSEKNYFLFTPLLHEVATGGLNPQNIVEPIRKILGCCLHTFYLGKAMCFHLQDHFVETTDGIVPYDYLVLAPGAGTNFFGIPGARENSFTLKSLEDAIRLKNHCITLMERASHVASQDVRQNMLRFVIVGGGPTGVELAAELQEFLKQSFSGYYTPEIIADISIVLVQKATELIPQFPKLLREKSLEVLRKKGIKVLLGNVVTQVKKEAVELADGSTVPTETIVWVAGVQPANIPFVEPVARETDGRFRVNRNLQLENYSQVFVVGDAAGVKGEDGVTLPALAQVAVQEAKMAAENIKRQIDGQTLKPFIYRHAGSLVSLGQWMAVGKILNLALWGRFTWWIWRTVYLLKLVSWQKKVKVAVDWTINAFSPRDISRL